VKKVITADTLMPKYVSRFSCIGGDCEDTCCAGWRVDLDKESFLHYQSTFDPVLRPLVTRHLKRNPDSRTQDLYGHIAMVDSPCQECGFLSEAKLCLIQERLGESALSETCRTFPRTVRLVDGVHQMALTLACPEAARLALLQADAFEFVCEPREVSQAGIRETASAQGLPVEVMDEVRIFLFQLLRTGEMSLRERLAVIGLVCERVKALVLAHRPEGIPEVLAAVDRLLEDGTLLAPLEQGLERLDLQAKVATIFFRARYQSANAPRHAAVMEAVAKGLGMAEDGSVDADRIMQAYETGMARLKADPMTTQVLERYLMNEALRELLPWQEEDPFQHFASLLMRFAILRLMLVGRAADQESPLTAEQWVETVQVFSRKYSHTRDFHKTIRNSLPSFQWDRLDLLYQLL
jgi:lysine-N-methylase